MKPTVYDVAKAAGVSIATVSFAFSKPERVRDNTLARVKQAAADLGYVPSATARGLARGRTRALGLYAFDYLLDERAADAEDARSFPLYADEVQHGVELECRRLGYALMLGAGSEQAHVRRIVDVAGRVDGLITFAGVATPAELSQVAARIPVIELGAAVPDDWHTVRVDNFGGMHALTRHLIDAHGHRRLAYVGAPGPGEGGDRYAGFVRALEESNLQVDAPLGSYPAPDHTRHDGVAAAIGDLPDAFVCATDQEALTTLDTLADAGVRVPRDVAVTGFDGILAGALSQPPLTSVRQPMVEIGRAAARRLINEIGDAAAIEPLAEPLSTRVVLRASCGCR